MVENVQFTNNIVRRVGGAMHVTGKDDLFVCAPNDPICDDDIVRGRIIKIANNLFENVDGGPWWSTGDFLKIGAQVRSVTVEHNTVLHSGKAIATWGGRCRILSSAIT